MHINAFQQTSFLNSKATGFIVGATDSRGSKKQFRALLKSPSCTNCLFCMNTQICSFFSEPLKQLGKIIIELVSIKRQIDILKRYRYVQCREKACLHTEQLNGKFDINYGKFAQFALKMLWPKRRRGFVNIRLIVRIYRN